MATIRLEKLSTSAAYNTRGNIRDSIDDAAWLRRASSAFQCGRMKKCLLIAAAAINENNLSPSSAAAHASENAAEYQ